MKILLAIALVVLVLLLLAVGGGVGLLVKTGKFLNIYNFHTLLLIPNLYVADESNQHV